MKILAVNQCHYKRGGSEVVYFNTIDLLRSNGHEVACFSVLHPKNEPTEFEKYFIPAPDLRKSSVFQKMKGVFSYLYNKQAYKNINQLIRDFKPDVAHIHNYYATLSVSVLKALFDNHIPVVLTVHDYRLLCPANTLMDNKINVCEKCASHSPLNAVKKKCSDNNLAQSIVIALEAMYWRNIKSPTKYIDCFHFVSNFCKQKHVEFIPVIQEKSSVFYNFTQSILEKKDVETERYFLYFGRLSPEKGILTLIDAWKKLPQNMLLKIVGAGEQFEIIKSIIEKNNLSNISLLGYKTGDDLAELIKKAYFVIVPSEWYENNPMTIIEAYSCGVPVIGANIGGIPEIILNHKTGFTFQVKNNDQLKEIVLLADNLSTIEYEKMTKECIKFANNNFSSKEFYSNLISIYKKAINNKLK